MGEPALCLEHLSKSFGAVRALDDLSIEVAAGEMVGFLGQNGAGKSTTFYMIAGLVRPTSGRVRIFGHDTRRAFKAAMRQTGALVEAPAFYEYLSGRKNLELAARLRGVRDARKQIDGILEQVGLARRSGDKVGTYSQGMKQRLGLGAVLVGNPRLLLLDEPTNGLDPEATHEMLGWLREQTREQGLTVFLSSHLLYEVEEFCQRVIVIEKGRLLADKSVDELISPNENVVRVVFQGGVPEGLEKIEGVESIECLSANSAEFTLSQGDSTWLNATLVGRNCKVSALEPRRKTINEFFLSTTGDKE